MVIAWPRHNYTPGGGPGAVLLLVLSGTKLPEPLPISRSRHGMPNTEAATQISIAVWERATNAERFLDELVHPFAELVEGDVGPTLQARSQEAQWAYIISGRVPDPDDLSHVQATWALAKCMCEHGAMMAIDVPAARVHAAGDVEALAPDRPFDLMHEVTLYFDDRPEEEMVAWTAGMQKFGRPNLLFVGIPRDYAAIAAQLLRDVASALVDGARLEIDDTMELAGRTLLAIPLPADHGTPIDIGGHQGPTAIALKEIERLA